MNLVNGRYGVIDLPSGAVETRDAEEGHMNGPSATLSTVDAAATEAGGDALVIASGLLTGSLVPAACSGFMRVARAGADAERTCPLLGFAGVELKLSGFDFVVIAGEAAGYGYLWIRDGIMEFVPAPEMVGMDAWERTDRIRSEQGDRKIQVLAAGPWSESHPTSSQMVVNYWGGEDKIGGAGEFSRRKLTAVAFRGMGELELESPEEHLRSSVELARSHATALEENRGLESFSDVAAGEGFRELLHRNVSCFGCPYPCRSYYKLFEDPHSLSLGSEEPGYLAYDIAALERLSSAGLNARDTVAALMGCARRGADPLAIVEVLSGQGSAVTLESIDTILASGEPSEIGPSTPMTGFARSFDNPEDHIACIASGLCPRYWAKVGFDRESIAAVASSAFGTSIAVR